MTELFSPQNGKQNKCISLKANPELSSWNGGFSDFLNGFTERLLL